VKAMTRARAVGEMTTMGLSPPGILTFMFAVILTVCALVAKFFGAQIPLIQGLEFWAVLVAQVILITGCLVRSI
jgi:predicted aconitase with swiveling domain